jgi:hypothetical protein
VKTINTVPHHFAQMIDYVRSPMQMTRRCRGRYNSLSSGILRFIQGLSSAPKHSILNFPDHVIADRASRLGVSLGDSPSLIDASVQILKATEEDRYLTMLKSKVSTVEDDPQNLFVSKVSALCEVLTDEEVLGLDDHKDPSNKNVHVTRTRKKKSYDKTKVRRSSRIRKIKRKDL